MTPQAGYTPPSGQPYYDQTHLPSTRARVNYDLDGGGGRVLNLYYYWDTYNTSTLAYSGTDITGFSYAYDPLTTFKTQGAFYDGNGTNWVANHTENYSYDNTFDRLTSAAYGDGLPNASPSWSYDASGNRTSDSTNPGSWSYDNLNRMSASPMGSYGNDILGNRTSGPSLGTSMGWDPLNRMASFTPSGGGTTSYTYRADGLRALKQLGQTSTSFAYDGQMGFEDVDATGGTPVVTDYGLGARGLDRIQKGSAIVYPVYDGHGNMVSDLSASSGTYSVHDQRAFDAWGGIRNTDQTGDPKGRYCANLGHKQDDESGLLYMRARCYEANSGRFVSEDPAMHGVNWFVYGSNDPLNRADSTGKTDELLNVILNEFKAELFGLGGLIASFIPMLEKMYKVDAFVSSHPDVDYGRAIVAQIGIALIGIVGAVIVAAIVATVMAAPLLCLANAILVLGAICIFLACDIAAEQLQTSITGGE